MSSKDALKKETLLTAVRDRSTYFIEDVLKRRANPDAVIDEFGMTALHILADMPSTKSDLSDEEIIHNIMNLLLSYGAFVDTRDDIGYTPLIYAARLRPVATVRLLLENGADVVAESRERTSALSYAAWFGRQENIEELILWGGGKIQKHLRWAFHATFWDYQEDNALSLIRAGLKINILEAVMLVHLSRVYDEREWLKPGDFPDGKQHLQRLLIRQKYGSRAIKQALQLVAKYRIQDIEGDLANYLSRLTLSNRT